jgi:hypothetical protein
VKISRLLSLRRKFLYDLTVKGEEERGDALQEMERLVSLEAEVTKKQHRKASLLIFHTFFTPRSSLRYSFPKS